MILATIKIAYAIALANKLVIIIDVFLLIIPVKNII